MCVYVCECVCVYVCMDMYTKRERERLNVQCIILYIQCRMYIVHTILFIFQFGTYSYYYIRQDCYQLPVILHNMW